MERLVKMVSMEHLENLGRMVLKMRAETDKVESVVPALFLVVTVGAKVEMVELEEHMSFLLEEKLFLEMQEPMVLVQQVALEQPVVKVILEM
jgi:hypothetical protein